MRESDRDDRDDTSLIGAVGGYQRYVAMRRAMRAQWMKSRGVTDQRTTARVPKWLVDQHRFWCAAAGIPIVDNEATWNKACRAFLDIPCDHIETFTRDRRAVVFTAQPYFASTDGIITMEGQWLACAERYGLTFESSLKDSWHYLGRTILFALWLPGEADRA